MKVNLPYAVGLVVDNKRVDLQDGEQEVNADVHAELVKCGIIEAEKPKQTAKKAVTQE